MTQDQWGQARGSGSVVRGEVVPDDDTEELPTGQGKPMTRFQKVASAFGGNGPDRDEPGPFGTGPDEVVAVTSPGTPVTDTGADPPARPGETADQGHPAADDHAKTEPDMFGTAARAGNGSTSALYLGHGYLIPDAAQYTARWQQIQFKFVDDPHASVTEAADVIAQVTAKLEAAIQERQRSLRGRWGEGANADTEALREALLMYRAFLDQLIGPRAS